MAKLYRKKIHASMKHRQERERVRDTQISHRGNVGHEWQFPVAVTATSVGRPSPFILMINFFIFLKLHRVRERTRKSFAKNLFSK